MKPKARVTATYELNAKAAPQMEDILRNQVPPQISCTVIEVTTHAEQVPQPGREPVDADGGAAEGQPAVSTGAVDAGKDRGVGRASRKNAKRK